ncbi:MAG: BlaI/MecI/CopY family transcriptional regulator [Verrucomicrobia bacterium]|nr:BlaI/MecI/CopY family transcriptional regulator [Verrucomicrobiota bacterium]
MKPPLPKPTEAELGILRVLWRRGRATVREVTDVLNRAQPTGYTTVLKFLQIMTDKGLVQREELGRAHLYQPTLSEEQTQGQLVRDLLDRAFAGSAAKLVQRALSATPASAAELAQIKRLVSAMERKGR